MNDLTALIIATDPVVGALLALRVEACRYDAVVAEEGERLADAVARSRASVILVDGDHPDGCSPAFIREQRAVGRPVIVFSPALVDQDLRPRVDGLQLPCFAMSLTTNP